VCWSRSWVSPAKTAEPIEILLGAFVNISVPVCVMRIHRVVTSQDPRSRYDRHFVGMKCRNEWGEDLSCYSNKITSLSSYVYGQRETDWWLFCDAPSVFSRERNTNDSVTVTVSGIHTCNYGGYQSSLNYICITSGLNVPNIPAYRWDIHRLTATYFRCTSVIAGFRRHLVGKTLINVRYRDTDKLTII